MMTLMPVAATTTILRILATVLFAVAVAATAPIAGAAVWQSPTTSAPVATEANPLPSVATEGTTATTGEPRNDPAQDRLRFIIIGLVVLATVLSVLTVLLWRATSPASLVTVEAVETVETVETVDIAPAGARVDPLMSPTAPLPGSRPQPPAESPRS